MKSFDLCIQFIDILVERLNLEFPLFLKCSHLFPNLGLADLSPLHGFSRLPALLPHLCDLLLAPLHRHIPFTLHLRHCLLPFLLLILHDLLHICRTTHVLLGFCLLNVDVTSEFTRLREKAVVGLLKLRDGSIYLVNTLGCLPESILEKLAILLKLKVLLF